MMMMMMVKTYTPPSQIPGYATGENQQSKCKLHSAKWRKYRVRLLTVPLLKESVCVQSSSENVFVVML